MGDHINHSDQVDNQVNHVIVECLARYPHRNRLKSLLAFIIAHS